MFDGIKRQLKFLDRMINSSRTPEEYLLNGGLYPAIIRSKDFLAKYQLKSVISAQLFDSSEGIYYHNDDLAIIFKIRITAGIANELSFLFEFGFPKNTYINYFFKHSYDDNYILLSIAVTTTGRSLKISKRVLLSIRDKIIAAFKERNLACETVKPKILLNFYNQVLSQQNSGTYDRERFIFEQINDATSNDIDNNGVLTIAGILHNVFYTKQYPNVAAGEGFKNPFITLLEDIRNTELNFYYAVNIVPGTKDESNYRFNTAFILLESDIGNNDKATTEFINYMRYKLDWYIYPNKGFSLPQFINSLPLQYTKAIDEHFADTSINQHYPLNKLLEILPVGEPDESGTN